MLNKMTTNKQETVIILSLLFIISFSYMLFFTECVPFFFDDHEFHRDYVSTNYKELFQQLFSLNKGGISDGPRPVYGLFFKTLFPFFGYSYCLWRLAKAVVFSALILVFYLLGKKLLQKRSSAILCTFFVMTLFPTFLQNFGYNGPHIFAELFKISALLLFLYDFNREKTSWILQISIFFSALFAIRVYPPAYSIAAILPLFTLLSARKKMIRYLPLFFFIILIQFPITFQLGALNPNSTGIYGPKLINIGRFISNDFSENIMQPIPTMNTLYYKSFTAILTFFGFWLLVGCFLILILHFVTKRIKKVERYFCEGEPLDDLKKRGIILSSVWLLCELPYYVFLPEHAIRYSFALFVPFSILATVLITTAQERIQQNYRKTVSIVLLILLAGAILTNVAYVYAFRAGWGSSFIVFEKGMDYFAVKHTDQRIGVLYASGSVAEEYFYVNKSSETYTFGTGITYIKARSDEDFSEQKIQEATQNFNEFYVIKRITSYSKSAFPDVLLETYPSMQLETVEEGFDKTILFDRWNAFLVNMFNISYEPNKIYIYKYNELQ